MSIRVSYLLPDSLWRRSVLTSTAYMLTMLLAATAVSADAPGSESEAPIDYARQIKPVLSARCYSCHGPDRRKQENELRLDIRREAVKEAIVPGKSDASPLVARIITHDRDEQMPPHDSGKPRLTPAEVKLIRAWIKQGAKFGKHWAYEKPRRAPLPVVRNRSWPSNAIDHFVAAQHERRKMHATPAAGRRTLIRRLSLDLTGLPPTPKQVAAFLEDKSPKAYEKVIDRLLASPAFGERMAVYWLDLVRFADTNGYLLDGARSVSPYRDYVIGSFNENKPFDQFTIEQIAGDLLPKATVEQKVASAYNRLLMLTAAVAQPKDYLAKYVTDRVSTTSTVWLGSTMGCAECHDHKYDPFTSSDFYSFGAFFADIEERGTYNNFTSMGPLITVASMNQKKKLAELQPEITKAEQAMYQQTPEITKAQAQWLAALATSTKWHIVHPKTATAKNGSKLEVLADGSVAASGPRPATDTYSISVKAPLAKISAVRIEVFPDKALVKGGPGRSYNGNFVLSQFQMTASGATVKLQSPTADYAPQHFEPIRSLNPQPKSGWAVHPHFGKPHHITFETSPGSVIKSGANLVFALAQNWGQQHMIGRLRLSVTTSPRPVAKANGLPAHLLSAVQTPAQRRTAKQKQALDTHFRSITPLLKPQRDRLAALEKKSAAITKTSAKCLLTRSVAPREMRVLPRGNWRDETGPVVKPRPPKFLPPLPRGAPASRLGLAKWLVADDNPLVARVMVNRLWQICHGRALVGTTDDFGSLGNLPSHPALLDWLAVEFRESGWDIKHMIRLMASSATYRQSSVADATRRRSDPKNRWLARASRHRIEAEFVRDVALASAGLLVRDVGGRSVRPYQPAGYWTASKTGYAQDHGANLYRRGLYTYWKRSVPYPSFLIFDGPDRKTTCTTRDRSVTPLQSLVLLNDPVYVEAARVLANRVLAEGGDTDQRRIAFAYDWALGRPPESRENELLLHVYQKAKQRYAKDSAAAGKIVRVGESPIIKGTNVIELAAWTAVMRTILNLPEMITRN